MTEVEIEMCHAVRNVFKISVETYPVTKRADWVLQNAGQVEENVLGNYFNSKIMREKMYVSNLNIDPKNWNNQAKINQNAWKNLKAVKI